MACNTQNVKLGSCFVKFGDVDLGLTKGGVEVEVTTETHPVTVDQFGDTLVNDIITKRMVSVSVPLAETTIENMVEIMPGATLVDAGTKQVWTSTEATVVDATEYTITIDTIAYSYTTSSTLKPEWATGLAAAINDSGQASMIATAPGDDVVLTHKISGTTAVVVESGGTATGSETTPAVAGAKRVDVNDGVNTDLLSSAKQLTLHPKALPFSDKSEDFIIPTAATPGALTFNYIFDQERIYSVSFNGYVDCATGELFRFGDPAAA